MPRQKLFAAIAAAFALSVFGTTAAVAMTKTSTPATATKVADPKALYRQDCGKCHALAVALAAGFGSGSSGGLGKDGGPSFNNLRIPYVFSVTAVTEPTGGHELLQKKISYKNLAKVAKYIAAATKHNPFPALPTDG
jgi:mono/diheme cytochrome c family protein